MMLWIGGRCRSGLTGIRWRKVRTRQDTVVDNVHRLSIVEPGTVPQKGNRRRFFGTSVRVKGCGKSAPPGR